MSINCICGNCKANIQIEKSSSVGNAVFILTEEIFSDTGKSKFTSIYLGIDQIEEFYKQAKEILNDNKTIQL